MGLGWAIGNYRPTHFRLTSFFWQAERITSHSGAMLSIMMAGC